METKTAARRTSCVLKRNVIVCGMNTFLLWMCISLLCVTRTYAVTPPFITQHPEGDTVLEGNVEVLRCDAIGDVPLSYLWWKNSSPQGSFSDSSTLRLSNIERDDAGEYRCLVENPVGVIMSKVADVNVAYIGSFPSSTSSETIAVGEAYIISCPPIESYPEPTKFWTKDGVNINSGGRVIVTRDGRLVILDVETSDAGSYICNADNAVGAYRMRSQPINVLVISTTTNPATIPPTIIVPPEDVTVHEGETLAELECIVNARPMSDLEITWKKNGITYRTGGTELFKLQIRNPRMADEGRYECEATLTGSGSVVTASANLTYFTMPTFSVAPSDITISPVGSTVVIPCQATGTPQPTLQWYRNAVVVTTLQDSRYQILTTGSLQVRNLQKSDGAMYQCRIFNEVGEDIKDTWLQVKEIAPEFTSTPNNTLILAGEMALFECSASGAPVPTIEWFKDGTPVASEEGTLNSRYVFSSGNLQINDAETTDSGLLMCKATNTKGSINITADFRVYVRTYITTKPVNTEEVLTQRTVLDCIVHHDARVSPVVVWYRDDQEVDISGSNINLLPTGSLEIRSVSQSDAGRYRCEVTSLAGNDHGEAMLVVIELPYPPQSLRAAISSSDSRTITLTWVAPFNGNTPLLRYIISQKEDQSSYREIESTVDPSVTTFDVVGVKPSRSYQYKIRAENKVGEGQSSGPSIVVSLPPEPPDDPAQRVVASASSTGSIIVEWQEPLEDSWNGRLLGYIVRHRLDGYQNNQWTSENITNVRQTSYTITGLLTWQRYEIQVAAYNGAGVGTFSSSVREQTYEGTPSEPPKDVSIRAVNSTSIKFMWAPPDPWTINGINQGYKLHAWEPGMENDKLELIIPPSPGKTTFTEYMVDLKKYTQYVTTVLCYTNPGNGPPSSPITLRTHEDIPGPVMNLRVSNVQATSLTLEWDPPMEENGDLTGYSVRYSRWNNSLPALTEDLQPDRTHLHVTQLTAETTYVFSVWAKTSVGPGDMQTTIINSGTPPVIPEAPSALAVSNVRSRSVYLQFTPGDDGHASISRWTVEALVGSNAIWTAVFSISAPDADAFDITGLQPYTAYTFRLIATNVAGDSPPSSTSNSIQTLADVPEIAPREVNVRAYNENSLRVRWVPLVDREWNGEAVGYFISWSREGTTADNQPRSYSVDDPYASEYIIPNLEEYTAYEVTIEAVNIIGNGPTSPPRVEWTHETVPSAGPENLNAVNVDRMSVRVTWGEIPVADRNGVILGYKVIYRETSGSFQQMEKDIPDSTTRETTIDGLKGYTEYSILMVGRTRVGDGAPSDEITIVTRKSEPGPPKDLLFETTTESSANLKWKAPMEPNGVISDYRVDYRLSSNSDLIETQVVTNMEFTASGLQRNRRYTFIVTARNSIGWGESATADVITSTQRSVPDAPTKVIVGRVESRQVTLSWTPGSYNNAPLRYYRIRARISGGSWMDQATSVPADALSYTITGLNPDTRYQFKIQAINDVGPSPFSPPSDDVTTSEDVPEGAPTIIDVTPLTTTSVHITWQAPPSESHNGDLLGYQVIFRQLSGEIEMQRLINDPNAVDYTLVSLIKFQNYEIKVAAFNSKGAGPFSRPETVFVGEAAPSAPPSNVRVNPNSATSLTVSWSQPPEESLNGGLQGYKVIYWEISAKRDATVWTRTYSTLSTVVVLDGLVCATTYGIQVKGFNAAGDGPASDMQMSTTEEDVPGPVEFLIFSQIRMTSVIVSWGKPPQSCGNITYYKLSYHPIEPINGEKSLITREIPASKMSYYVSELGANVLYVFEISARTNRRSQYGPTVVQNVTTGPQKGAPGVPTNVRLGTGHQMLTITWDQPASYGDSPILGYLIEFREKDQTEWSLLTEEIPPSERMFEFSFKKLKASTIYMFRVLAENAQGVSLPGYPPDPFDTSAVHLGPPVNFYEEWWFLVIVALVGIIIIILVGATLCMLGRSKLYKEKKKGKRVNHVHQPAQDDTDFANIEMNAPRRGQRNGNYTSTNSYRRLKLITRPPPKPSPGSVQYSEEEESKHYEPLSSKREAGETSSLTERYAESVGSESEPELKEEAMDTFVNHYASLPSNQNWRQHRAPQAYSYTDSEPDPSNASVTMYNNGLAQLEAGSRTPIHGLSSFV